MLKLILVIVFAVMINKAKSFHEKTCPIDEFIPCPMNAISCSKNECCPDDYICCKSGCGFVCIGKNKKMNNI